MLQILFAHALAKSSPVGSLCRCFSGQTTAGFSVSISHIAHVSFACTAAVAKASKHLLAAAFFSATQHQQTAISLPNKNSIWQLHFYTFMKIRVFIMASSSCSVPYFSSKRALFGCRLSRPSGWPPW